MALNSFSHLRMNDTDPVQILSLEVLFGGLDNKPDFGLFLDAHVTEFDSHSHFSFQLSTKI